ncbi:MAG: metallophosphatase domain-containing protein [Vulcanimicrobiaceae bacterium]
MRIVIVSDTHLRHDFALPDGDMLLHCGDETMDGRTKQLKAFGEWLAAAPHRHKIVIAGNHELTLERFRSFPKRYWPEAVYLQDSAVTIEGLKIYGSPWQPWFHDWAFNLPPGEHLARKWAMIPDDTDILVTHGPPQGILDTVRGEETDLGCADLLKRVQQVQPALHAFGHIHSANGALVSGKTLFVNASICDEEYQATQKPWIVDIGADGTVLGYRQP